MNFLDIAIIVFALAFALGGYRNGAVIGVLSMLGFLSGLVLGSRLAEPIASRITKGQAQVPIAVGVVVLSGLLVQAIGVTLGRWLRSRVTWTALRTLDSAIGAIFGIITVLAGAWLIALPLASAPYPAVVSAVRNSTIVGAVDSVMPKDARTVYSSLRSYLDRSGFPPVFGDLSTTPIVDVPEPDTALVNSAAVSTAHQSVFKVYGTASSCDRQIEGSGFVFAPHRVLTNAHVVAGTDHVTVEVGTVSMTARVVLYDPERDIAVLYVPALDAPVLNFATAAAKTDDSAVVLGYPQDGPFDVRAARVRGKENLDGHDIYGKGTITREIYSVRALVRSGNSGGPLITPQGSVLGVVFATALDSTDTGFVLTNSEITPDVSAGANAVSSVGTGACTAS